MQGKDKTEGGGGGGGDGDTDKYQLDHYKLYLRAWRL